MLDRILIIGGTGFIGSNLTRKLVEMGYSPTILARNIAEIDLQLTFGTRVNWFECNVSDYNRLRDYVLDLRPSLIVNLSGTNSSINQTPEVFEALNFDTVRRLFEIAQEAEVKRFIQIGSADEYGSQPIPQSESLKLSPKSGYARTKAKATLLALSMHEKLNFPVVVLRPFTVYGFGQPSKMFFSQLIHSAIANEEFRMTEGSQKRDYVFIEDVVSAIISSAREDGIEGQAINIGTGKSFSLREIATRVFEKLGVDRDLLRIGALPGNTSEFYDTCADITKAKKLLNWNPTISFDEGLDRTISAILNSLGNKR
jgi:nucleoside-diphosphate-sugar epimerase